MYLYDIIHGRNGHICLYKKETFGYKKYKLFDIILLLYKHFLLKSAYVEYFYIAAFNKNDICKGIFQLSKGNINSTDAPLEPMLSFLTLINAKNFAMFHNHPNNICYESDADINQLDTAIKITKPLNIKCIGSYILTRNAWKKVGEEEIYEYYDN